MRVITEIIQTPLDQEIVFDYAADPERYVELRKWMYEAGSDILALIPPRIIISKGKHLLPGFPPESQCLGVAFGRYFLHRAENL